MHNYVVMIHPKGILPSPNTSSDTSETVAPLESTPIRVYELIQLTLQHYVQITQTPVSTNFVPGIAEGAEILTDSNGNFYVKVTKIPVSTNTVPGPVGGTETLNNSAGEFYEQVTTVTKSVVSTNTVPGPAPGTSTETLTNANGELFEQVTSITEGVVSTHTYPGPSLIQRFSLTQTASHLNR